MDIGRRFLVAKEKSDEIVRARMGKGGVCRGAWRFGSSRDGLSAARQRATVHDARGLGASLVLVAYFPANTLAGHPCPLTLV